MAWYYGNYSCGHEGRVDIIGPHKDREWKKDRAFARLCPDCYQKEREERIRKENEEAAALTKEWELPELTGSDKQIAWANSIRVNVFEKISKLEKQLRESGKSKAGFYHTKKGENIIISSDDIVRMIERGFAEHVEARFWIDYRSDLEGILTVFYDEYKEDESIPSEVKKEMQQENENLTSRPEPEKHKKTGVVEIVNASESIKLLYVKDYDFIKIVKEYRFSWEGGAWIRKISELTGSFADRAGEIGNALLANGFAVRFPDTESKEKAVSGTFIPECDRWVKKYSDNKLGIWWREKSDVLYRAARVLPGAHWRDGKMIVSVEYYNEIQEFADTLKFLYTREAADMVDAYKKIESGYSIDSVAIPDNSPIPDQELLKQSLERSGLIEDLKDEIE